MLLVLFWGWGFFVFLELLSLLVIHLCKHCHYQPQHLLWLTLWCMRCSLQRANTSHHSGSDLLQLALYDREKKIAELLQDQQNRPCMKSEDRSF